MKPLPVAADQVRSGGFAAVDVLNSSCCVFLNILGNLWGRVFECDFYCQNRQLHLNLISISLPRICGYGQLALEAACWAFRP